MTTAGDGLVRFRRRRHVSALSILYTTWVVLLHHNVPPARCFHPKQRSGLLLRQHDNSRVFSPFYMSSSADSAYSSSLRTRRSQQQRRRRQNNNNKIRETKEDFVTTGTKTKPMPIKGYDASAIIQYYDCRPLQVGWRLNILGFPLLGWYLGLLTDRALGISDKTLVQKMRGKELRKALVRSGSVALIKSGQALSLRPDIIRNKFWAEELGKLVDAVGAFSDKEAMKIVKTELADLLPRLEVTKSEWASEAKRRRMNDEKNASPGGKKKRRLSSVENLVQNDPILSLFEFTNDNKAVASASIGQVYKARIRRGAQLEAAIGKEEAARWGGKLVAIKVQRPDVEASASLDMYLLRRTAMWLSKFRGGDLPAIADQFGMQLFGELDYIREANNCERFRELYGSWTNVEVPAACSVLTRRRVLVMEWIDGEKGPWRGNDGLDMVGTGLRCSVDQLMNTGLFHADPHRGNMLRTPEGKLSFIDFGMMADIDEDDRYGLFGLVIGLQNKNLPLVTENLLKLGFLEDTTQLDLLVPRLRGALMNSTGGTGKASNVNFAKLQEELDKISRENVLRFSTPPFFTVILRSLTILEGVALSVDPNFRLVRGAYPYVIRQLLYNKTAPDALQKLLIQLLTVEGKGQEIDWETLRDFLRLARAAAKKYVPSAPKSLPQKNGAAFASSSSAMVVPTTTLTAEEEKIKSRQTIELFFEFLTSKTGLFLKKPLVHELAEAIDGLASMGEANLQQTSLGLIPLLPGMNGPVNTRRIDEIRTILDTFQKAGGGSSGGGGNTPRLEAMMEFLRELSSQLNDMNRREETGPLLEELQSVIQMVAVEVLEIRGSRAMRSILRLETAV